MEFIKYTLNFEQIESFQYPSIPLSDFGTIYIFARMEQGEEEEEEAKK